MVAFDKGWPPSRRGRSAALTLRAEHRAVESAPQRAEASRTAEEPLFIKACVATAMAMIDSR